MTTDGGRTSGAAAIDPRIRARRLEVVRAEGRKRLRLVGVVAAALALALAGVAVLHSPLLAVRTVKVEGVHETPAATVLAATGLGGHPLMVDVDTTTVERQVDALPWVASAAVTRRWPSTVEVRVSEREAFAQMRRPDGRWALVDLSGRVLGLRPVPQAGLMYLQEPGQAGRPGSFLGPSATPALEVARSLPPELRGRVSTVATAAGSVDLSLVPTGTAVLGPPVELGQKYESLLTVLHEVDLAGVTVVDVHVPADPAIRH